MPSELPGFPLEELLKRYFQGDLEVCKQLLQHPHYCQRVETIARHRTYATGLNWEDAVQEVHIKVLNGMRDRHFRWGGEKEFYRWLEKVAENTIWSLLRRENRKNKWIGCSLDQPIQGTNIPIKDSLVDDFNLADAVERADTVLRILQAINQLELRYPRKKFLQLWQGLSKDKKQTEIARELQVQQGEISKRKRELVKLVATELELASFGQVKQELRNMRQGKLKQRKRSNNSW